MHAKSATQPGVPLNDDYRRTGRQARHEYADALLAPDNMVSYAKLPSHDDNISCFCPKVKISLASIVTFVMNDSGYCKSITHFLQFYYLKEVQYEFNSSS